MGKFNINPKKVFSLVMCAVVAGIAFRDEREKQKQEEEFEDLKSRVAQLEGNEEESE